MILETEVKIPVREATLNGNLAVPGAARGLVLFVHGSGSSRHSPRNRFVARMLNKARLATLLFDLLTPGEESVDIHTRQHRFDIRLLATRLCSATGWVLREPATRGLPIGYFGSSTGGGAALVAAAAQPDHVSAVVSRGGRPDLAGKALGGVRAPTLLMVGGEDDGVIELNRQAMAQMRCEVSLQVIAGAGHLFEEPGTLERVSQLASEWIIEHLRFRQPDAAQPQ